MSAVRGQAVLYRVDLTTTVVAFVDSLVESDPTGNTANLLTLSGVPIADVIAGEGIEEWTPCLMPPTWQSQLDDKLSLGQLQQALQDGVDPDGIIDRAIQAALDARLGAG